MSFQNQVSRQTAAFRESKADDAAKKAAAHQWAKEAFKRIEGEFIGTPNIHLNMINPEELESGTYLPPRIQVSFYVERKRLFRSSTQEMYYGRLYDVEQVGDEIRCRNKYYVLGDRNSDIGDHTIDEVKIVFETSNIDDLLEKIATDYAEWREEYCIT